MTENRKPHDASAKNVAVPREDLTPAERIRLEQMAREDSVATAGPSRPTATRRSG